MTTYISEPVATDRGASKQIMVDSLEGSVPGLSVEAGTMLDFLLDVVASANAEDRLLLTEQLAVIFRYSGEKIDRVPQNAAVPATGLSTWVRTSADAALGARTVPAGTEVDLPGPDGEPVAFVTSANFTFSSGVTSTAAGAVGLTASIAGADGNGLQAGATPAQTSTWLTSVTLTAPTSGGVDAEDDDTYLNRLADTKPLQSEAITVADNLARWLRNQSGVDRALALDNYNGGSGVPGHITGVPVDSNGDALSSGTMTALQTAAQANTLTNLTVHIVAPTYTTITVVFAGVTEPGWDATDVQTRTQQAVLDFLDRAQWGLPSTGDQRLWIETTTVRFQDISTVLNNTPGFDHWTSLTINGGTADVVMTGPGALPSSSSTATGTITAT